MNMDKKIQMIGRKPIFPKGKVYASADWHGCGKLAKQVLNYLKPEDTLIFIGDAMDRGPNGYEIMKKLLSDDRVVYMRGNHEELMAEGLRMVLNGRSVYDSWWISNGGGVTWGDVELESDEILEGIITEINKMPTEVSYQAKDGHEVILEHAGYTPFIIPHRSHNPLWDRGHFYDSWTEDHAADNKYLVHGHTPVQYLRYEYGYKDETPKTEKDFIGKRQFMQDIFEEGEEFVKPEVIRYCGGHKFDVDMCTVYSDRVALLDLDTFEVIYFDDNTPKEE